MRLHRPAFCLPLLSIVNEGLLFAVSVDCSGPIFPKACPEDEISSPGWVKSFGSEPGCTPQAGSGRLWGVMLHSSASIVLAFCPVLGIPVR